MLLLIAGPVMAAKKAKKPVKPPPPALPGTAVQFTATDGWTLSGKFSPPRDGHLTFVLLHGVGSYSGEWGAFAQRLAAEGYGTLAYDGRGHGESAMFQGEKKSWRKFSSTGTANEWNQMSQDLDGALLFLSSQSVAASSVAFAGASVGANIMLKAAVAHKEIPLAILLSPGINYRDVMTVNPIRAYGKRPLLLAAAQNDNYAFQSATLLYNLILPVAGAEKALFLQAPDGHGAPLLNNPAMMDAVLGWIAAEEQGRPFTYVAASTAPAVSSPTATTTP